jgi:predicted SAM-dependent methyltransferase
VTVPLVRRGIDLLVTATAYLGQRRRLDPETLVDDPVVKINLGSGLEVAPGWINVDASLNALISRWPEPLQSALFTRSGYSAFVSREEYLGRLRANRFVHADLTRAFPFVDASADFVFTSHFLEHLTRGQCIRVLREARRVLKPSGVIRVAVPDLEQAVDLYRAGEARRMLDDHFYRPEEGRLAQHRYMYDFPLLAAALEEAGFADVRKRTYREGDVPDLELLDNRPDESLFVEASGLRR